MAASCKTLSQSIPQGPFSLVLRFLGIDDRLAVHDTSKAWREKAIHFFNLQKEIPNYTYLSSQLTVVRTASLCPNLTDVSLYGSGGIVFSDRVISTLLLKCQRLVFLHLEYGHWACAERTLAAFTVRAALPQYAPLKSLRLDRWHYKDEELAQIMESCTKLRELTLHACSNLGDRTIEALVTHCPDLKRLNINRNRWDPDFEKAALQERFKNGCQVAVYTLGLSHFQPRKPPQKKAT